jgi:hypothetical protein
VTGAATVSTGFGGVATQNLTRVDLTLAPLRRPGSGLARLALLAAVAFAAGFGAAEIQRAPEPAPAVQAAGAPAAELVQLRQQLEQAGMGLRLADARSQELERQIDTLNQKLTEAQDELTFFRKAREGKKH